MTDPYQSYLLQRVEKMTDAERRHVDARTGEIAAAFARLRREATRRLRSPLLTWFSRPDRRTDITAIASGPDRGSLETQPEDDRRDELTTVGR